MSVKLEFEFAYHLGNNNNKVLYLSVSEAEQEDRVLDLEPVSLNLSLWSQTVTTPILIVLFVLENKNIDSLSNFNCILYS